MEDVSRWVEDGIATVVALGGLSGWIHMRFTRARENHELRLQALRSELKAEMEEMDAGQQARLTAEREERRKDVSRLEDALRDLRDVPKNMALLGQGLQHLTDRFTDYKETQDRAMDDVKRTMQGVDTKLDTAIAAQVRSFGRPPRRRKTDD